MGIGLAALILLAAWPSPSRPAPGMRVLSLDQCADQYVLALTPRERIVGVSHRAGDQDAYLRQAAAGLPRSRASYEAVFAARPTVVVRYWGGDAQVVRALERRDVRVVTIDDASDFDGVRANLRRVSAALGEEAAGRRLEARLEADLAAARGAWGGRKALYLTPGGFTSGGGSMVDAILRAAGMTNAAEGPGYRPAPLESLVLSPPAAFVLGFFDMARYTAWDLARHPVLERVRRGRTAASLPGKYLGCPAWFQAEGARVLAGAARR